MLLQYVKSVHLAPQNLVGEGAGAAKSAAFIAAHHRPGRPGLAATPTFTIMDSRPAPTHSTLSSSGAIIAPFNTSSDDANIALPDANIASSDDAYIATSDAKVAPCDASIAPSGSADIARARCVQARLGLPRPGCGEGRHVVPVYMDI